MLQPHLTDLDLAFIALVVMFAVTGFGTFCWAVITAVSHMIGGRK